MGPVSGPCSKQYAGTGAAPGQQARHERARPLRCPRALGPLAGHRCCDGRGRGNHRPSGHPRTRPRCPRTTTAPTGHSAEPRLRDASGQEKPREADTGICGNARLSAREGDHWIEYVLWAKCSTMGSPGCAGRRTLLRGSWGLGGPEGGLDPGARAGWKTAGLWMLSGSSGSILADMTGRSSTAVIPRWMAGCGRTRDRGGPATGCGRPGRQ